MAYSFNLLKGWAASPSLRIGGGGQGRADARYLSEARPLSKILSSTIAAERHQRRRLPLISTTS
jgi:hypothetical protein